jgi:hypothetical protein
LPETTYLSVVIAGLDPVIPSESGGYGGARIKSGHDGVGMDCLCPDLILMPMAKPGMTRKRYAASNAKRELLVNRHSPTSEDAHAF